MMNDSGASSIFNFVSAAFAILLQWIKPQSRVMKKPTITIRDNHRPKHEFMSENHERKEKLKGHHSKLILRVERKYFSKHIPNYT